MIQALDLRDQFIEHFRVRFGIDFALENLFGPGQCDHRYFLTQMFARRIYLLIDIGSRRGLDLVGFIPRSIFGFVNNLVGTFLRLIDDFLCLLLGFTEAFANFCLGFLKVLLSALCSGQALGNLPVLPSAVAIYISCKSRQTR
jgi:hypothetical protein